MTFSRYRKNAAEEDSTFKLVTTSCIVMRIVTLNIDKDGGMFCQARPRVLGIRYVGPFYFRYMLFLVKIRV